MNSKAKEHLRKYYLHSEQRSVDGFDNSLFQGRTKRQVEVTQMIGVLSFAALVVVVFVVVMIKLIAG